MAQLFQHTLAMRLRVAYLTLHRRFNAHFAERGVTADQFVLLSLLAENDGITQSQLGRLCASDPNTITAMLRVLARRDLVRRVPHAGDGRARCVHLTDEGRSLQMDLVAFSERLHDQFVAAVRPAERGPMEAALVRLAETMAAPAPIAAVGDDAAPRRRGRRPAVVESK